MNQQQGDGRPRLTDAGGEWRLACVVWFNSRAAVAQFLKKQKTKTQRNGSDRKQTVHHSALTYFT